MGCLSNFFICLPVRKLIAGKWNGYKALPNDYDVFVNPKIEKSSVEEVESEEVCCSLAGLGFQVSRPSTIRISWRN